MRTFRSTCFSWWKGHLEEPHSIAELVREYESEEKELNKDKKWLEDKWTKEWNETDIHDPRYQYISEFIADINQLDEPEVLSSDWIKDKQLEWTSIFGSEYYVPTKELYGKIVPKQELTVVPNYVAKWISKHYERLDLYPALKRLENNAMSWDDVYEWYRGNTRKFVNAYLTGIYEVEEEQVMEWLDNNDFYDYRTAETVLANAVEKSELSYYGTKYSVVKKETETVADVVTTFWKSYERLKEVMSMEVEELEK